MHGYIVMATPKKRAALNAHSGTELETLQS